MKIITLIIIKAKNKPKKNQKIPDKKIVHVLKTKLNESIIKTNYKQFLY